MTTYSTMVTRIANETKRPNLSDEIKNAIQEAITYYEKRRFWFNSERATASLVSGQTYYGVPSDFIDFIGQQPLEITVNSLTFPLHRRDWDYLQEIDPGTITSGQPYDWAYYDKQLRFYPTPDDSYTVYLAYAKSLGALSADADTNAWMVEAESLIRHRAKALLYADVIHMPEKAALHQTMAEDQLKSLRGLTGSRASSGRTRPSYL